ncbi:MAG: cytochrome c [Planctomycetaceae bacterium]|nr:cytochrome c [Planctomycetaceae bacterium]
MISFCLCCALTLIFASGCSKKKPPSFIESEKAISLIPEVREAISSELTEIFGTVSNPQAPDWLPIERGGIQGTIKEIKSQDRQGRTTSLTIKLKEPFTEIKVGDIIEVHIASKKVDTTKQVSILSFEKKTGILTLAEPLTKSVIAGTKCILNPNSNLIAGQQLYYYYCLKCHAVTGDGKGPQASILKPKPRDFRLGLIKYTSTKPNIKASSKDLHKLLKSGIAGTGMPAFQLLGNHEIATLVEYTKYLSMRGEIERGLCIEAEIDFTQSLLDEELSHAKSAQQKKEVQKEFQEEIQDFLKSDFPEIVQEISLSVAESWIKADDPENVLMPTVKQTNPLGPSQANPDVSSLANGKMLYLSTSAQCVSCHGKTGKGDGDQTTQFQKRPDGTKYEKVGLHDTWGLPVTPRDLTYGVFCGGREPIDLFRRISAGVKGTPMPAFGGKGLNDEQIWDLVNYIYYLGGEYPNAKP